MEPSGRRVVVNKGTTVQVEQFFLGSYMEFYTIHARRYDRVNIRGFVNECLSS